MALGDTSEATDDDSFGAQQILKNQERYRPFAVTGDGTWIYTSNAALTPADTRSDGLFVVNAGAVWSPKISTQFETQVSVHTSLFRYIDNSALDFENFGFSAATSYAVPSCAGLSIFARYDFTELLNRHGRQILSDHEFTLGLQKAFVLGRSHYLTVGVAGSAGLSDPYAAQRDILGAFVSYHLNLTRSLEADLSYRFGGNFYDGGSRTDRNQLLSCSLRYQINRWVNAEAFITYGNNRSDASVFDYDVFTGGGGVGFNVRF